MSTYAEKSSPPALHHQPRAVKITKKAALLKTSKLLKIHIEAE
jgi:hypothetical protein